MKRVALLAVLAVLAGCAADGPALTIRELGHPAFAAVVGSDARFVQAPPQPRARGLDAWPAEGEPGGVHRSVLHAAPAGLEDAVLLAVGVAVEREWVPLRRLAVACFAVRDPEGWEFFRTGKLPRPDEVPLDLSHTDQPDSNGVLKLLVRLPRERIPAGTERLAFPILFQFQDGWIHLAWYHSIVPPPQPLPAEDGPR